MTTPKSIEQLDIELTKMLDADDKPYLKIEVVAKYLGIDKMVLRRMMYAGTCPFGFGMEGDKYGNGFGKISKLAFYNWMTKRH